jgi:hypothetical protein
LLLTARGSSTRSPIEVDCCFSLVTLSSLGAWSCPARAIHIPKCIFLVLWCISHMSQVETQPWDKHTCAHYLIKKYVLDMDIYFSNN